MGRVGQMLQVKGRGRTGAWPEQGLQMAHGSGSSTISTERWGFSHVLDVYVYEQGWLRVLPGAGKTRFFWTAESSS